MQVRVVFSGRSYDAAKSLPGSLALPDGAAVDEALRVLAELMPEGRSLPKSCLVAVCGAHLGTVGSHRAHVLRDGDELVLIAPVAGG
ncbi:MAG: MoaD/ThiS family protein [Pirellulales bacterium]|nr:MoaD/ThiS family protein [Pirellulales bacterium]